MFACNENSLIFVNIADVKFTVNAVEVVVGLLKFTVSVAHAVVPATVPAGTKLVVLRNATVRDADPAVDVEVFNPRLIQSMSNGPEEPVVKAIPKLLL